MPYCIQGDCIVVSLTIEHPTNQQTFHFTSDDAVLFFQRIVDDQREHLLSYLHLVRITVNEFTISLQREHLLIAFTSVPDLRNLIQVPLSLYHSNNMDLV